MRVHQYVALLLVLCAPRAAAAQVAPPSLQDAELAFAAALDKHDRAAFVAMLAPDAESTLPTAVRGPEAVANSWLPFLIDPGTTLILTSTAAATSAAGDTGTSSGTFAIRGRTGNGVQTIPAGTYTLNWRLVEGRWKITAIGGGGRGERRADAGGGTGAYRFGMTRNDVTRVADCAPYTPVAVTGGLECPHYRFDGREMNISFLFAGDALRRIQLWYYEGESRADAQQAVGALLAFFKRTAGGATITARPELPVNEAAVIGAIDRGPVPRPGEIVHVEICGPSTSGSERWFARVGRHQHGYMVMLFAEPSAAR
jgi:ketosteroid isomerase-like protein